MDSIEDRFGGNRTIWACKVFFSKFLQGEQIVAKRVEGCPTERFNDLESEIFSSVAGQVRTEVGCEHIQTPLYRCMRISLLPMKRMITALPNDFLQSLRGDHATWWA